MPRPTPTRVVAGVLALGGATAVGLVAYDQLGRETFAAEPPLTSALPRDETLHIECVRRPLLGELWGIGRQPAGLIQGAPPAGAWWAPLPRAGRLRVLDERWAVVELTEQPVPCSGARAARRGPDGSVRDAGPGHVHVRRHARARARGVLALTTTAPSHARAPVTSWRP